MVFVGGRGCILLGVCLRTGLLEMDLEKRIPVHVTH